MNKKGSLTLLFCMLLPAFLWLFMFCVETLHLSLASSCLDSACYAAARGELSDYQSQTRADYGIFIAQEKSSQERGRLFSKTLMDNLEDHPLLDMRLREVSVEASQKLTKSVLKNQILESVKYIAPLEGVKALKGMLESVKKTDEFDQAGNKASAMGEAQDKLEETTKNNKIIKENDEEIKDINKKMRKERAKESPNEAHLRYLQNEKDDIEKDNDRYYAKNQRLVQETDEIIRRYDIDELPPPEKTTSWDGEERLGGEIDRLAQAKRKMEERTGWQEDPPVKASTDQVDNKPMKNLTGLADGLKNILIGGRNHFYLGEYVLHYMDSVVDDPLASEVEYVITGSDLPVVSYMARLFLVKTALDSLGYFFDPLAPPDLLARVVYAVLMGGIQGACDMVELVGMDEKVPLVHTEPGTTNIFGRVQLSYEDHQRIDLMLTGENSKLERIGGLVSAQGTTAFNIQLAVGVERIFPFFPLPRQEESGNQVILRRKLRVSY